MQDWLSQHDEKTIFHATRTIDHGFELSGGYNIRSFIQRVLVIAFPVTIFVMIVIALAQRATHRRIQRRHELEVIKTKAEHFQQTQKLIRGVMHDIQSPLTTLTALGRNENDHEKRSLMDHVIRRMQTIIADLACQEKSSGDQDRALIPINKTMTLFLQEKTREHGETIHFEYHESSAELWVHAVYSEYLRVLSNIINNACEASPSGATVHIDTQPLQAHHSIRITIRDHGKGIPRDVLPKLFAEGATFGKSNGSGFGLYNAKRVLNEHGGSIDIASEVGVGTCITLELPAQQPPPWAIDELALGGIDTLIVVDDEDTYGNIWRGKISPSNVTLMYLPHPNSIPTHFYNRETCLLLVDNNFGQDCGLGLKFLAEARCANSILVTSDWARSDVQSAVEKLQLRLIGKDFIEQMKVVA